MGCLNLIWSEDSIQPNIAVLDRDESTHSVIAMGYLKSQDNVNIIEVSSLDEGVDRLRDGDVEVFLVIPRDFGEKWENISDNGDYESIILDVYHSAEGQEEELLNTLLKGITSEINTFIEGERKKPVHINSRRLDLDRGSASNMLLPAGISIVIVHVGIYASSSNSSRFKELNLSKRLKSSSKDPIFSNLGMVSVDSLFTSLAGTIALAFGSILFEINISATTFMYSIILFLISSFTFNLIGHIIGKNSDIQTSSQSISSMVVFPILFFTQAYLFSWLFPNYIIQVTQFLPTFPLVQGMKDLYFSSPTLTGYFLLIFINSIWVIGLLTIIYFQENRRN